MTKKPATLEMADDLENEWGLTMHADEMRRLYRIEVAFKEWIEKTEWLQKDAKPGELGMHRADVLRLRITHAYDEGRSSGLYAARNALNDKFGL